MWTEAMFELGFEIELIQFVAMTQGVINPTVNFIQHKSYFSETVDWLADWDNMCSLAAHQTDILR